MDLCSWAPVVQTQNGPVRGLSRRYSSAGFKRVDSYWALPFAEPPVGENRLRAPKPVATSWSTPRAADRPPRSCLWGGSSQAQEEAHISGSGEDCLYLNVFAPEDVVATKRRLPVMVWFYGGGFTQGDSCMSILGFCLYDGDVLAGLYDVVVVTMNYRLSGMGFFVSEGLRAEDDAGSTGNMALLDQRQALRWVQANIAQFGGNPDEVTIFGESAGAFSVLWHLVSEPSWGFFHKAIVQSGTSKLSWFFQPHEKSQEFYGQWAEAIGCPRSGSDHLPCLRRVDASMLVDPPPNITVASPTYPAFPVGPTIDGVNLLGTPYDLARSGKFNKVPLIIGACEDGGTLFEVIVTQTIPGMHRPYARTKRDLVLVANWTFHEDFRHMIFETYPDHEFMTRAGVDYHVMLSRILRDLSFQCSDRDLAEAWIDFGAPVWLYTFSLNLGPLDRLSGLGDLHGTDVLFTWRHFLWLPDAISLHDATAMANLMNCKWAAFAHSGSPEIRGNSTWPTCSTVWKSHAPWPSYNQETRLYYSLQLPPKVGHVRGNNSWPDDEFPSDVRCDLWASAQYPWHPLPSSSRVDGPLWV